MSTQTPIKTIGDTEDAVDTLETLLCSLRTANLLFMSTVLEAESSLLGSERADPHMKDYFTKVYGVAELFRYIIEEAERKVEDYYGKQ